MNRRWITNLRLFWDGALLSYIALFRWLRPMQYLASKIFMPLAQILFFSVLGLFARGPESVDFFVIGNAMQLTAVNGIYGVTMSLGGDRWEGTLPYLFGTPANRMAMFLGRAFLHLVDGVFGVILAFAWGVLIFGLDLSAADPAALLLTILVATFSTAGLGLLMGCLSLVTLNVMFVNNTVYFLLLVFSGANIPVASLPGWMQAISWALPLTRGIRSARLLIDGAPLAEVAPLLAGEFAVGAFYALLGYSLFRWFEFQAKRRGTLEAF
ncbi:MAG TPA: ABC transporter permease [Anaerolineales bacterium]|nr:ABC transporter permease [Anaerolineales bacterium]